MLMVELEVNIEHVESEPAAVWLADTLEYGDSSTTIQYRRFGAMVVGAGPGEHVSIIRSVTAMRICRDTYLGPGFDYQYCIVFIVFSFIFALVL
jgi:hypothetical protein